SACCLVLKCGAELAPAGITDAFAEMMVPYQIGDPQDFARDDIILAHQRKRRLVVEVAPRSAHLVMVFGDQHARLLATPTALLAARQTLLGFGEAFRSSSVVTRVLHDLAVGGDEKDLQPDINARLSSGGWQGLGRYLRTGAADVPAVGLTREGDGLGRAPKGTGPAHHNAANLGQDQVPLLQLGAVAVLLIGERVVAMASLEAWEPRFLTSDNPTEEGLIRLVQAGQHSLQHVAMKGGVFGERGADVLQLCFLLEARGALALAASPPGDALFQRAVVECAAAPEHLVQRPLLGGRWLVFFLVGLAHAVHLIDRSVQPYSVEWFLGSRCLPYWRNTSASRWRAA